MNNKVFRQHIKKFIFWEIDFFSQKLDGNIYINSVQTEYNTKNTVDFTIFKNFIFIFDGEDFYISLDKNFKLRESGQFCTYRKISNDIILIQKIVNFQNLSIQVSLSNDGFSSFFSDNNLIVSRGGCFYKNNQLIYKKDNQNIEVLDVDKNSKTFFPLSTLGTWLDGAEEKPYQVTDFSGIYENTLLCNLNSGAVLLINIQDENDFTLIEEAKFPRKMYPKEEDSSIYCGLFGKRYIELDIKTKSIIKEINLDKQLRAIKNIPDETPNWFLIGFSTYQEGKFYFITETNFIGIFNPELGEIIDYHEFEFDKKQYQQLRGGEENLQVKDGKIYCLDNLGNLYELEPIK